MDFETPIDQNHSFSVKWGKYKGRNILPLWIADSDYQTAPVIIEALQERVAQGVFGYTDQPSADVKEAIVYHLKTQHNWEINSEWIVPLSSIVNGLTLSCLVAGEEGDSVLLPATIYPPFNYVISNTKRTSIRIPILLEDGRWILDFEALEASITKDTKILLFCNPHNPGGVVYTQLELEQLHNICERHELLICSDEIHCDLVLDADKKHIPIASLNEDAAKRTITLMAASKTYNVAGLGFGFAIIADTRLRKRYKKLVLEKMPEANLLGQVATAAAFKGGEPWRLAQIEHLRKNRDYLMEEINTTPGLKMFPLESTFLAWVDVSALMLMDSEKFFEDAGVGISAGAYFGDSHFIRINFACSIETLEEAVRRIRKAIAGLSASG
ncbi:MAG: cystathionine beta-lyase [Cocleimonas sp.]|jgi:cystathionine beta-lyase